MKCFKYTAEDNIDDFIIHQ